MMQYFRSALFALIFYPATLIYVLAGIAGSLFGVRPMRAVVHAWADLHHVLTTHLLGVHAKRIGSIPQGKVIVAVKHQSMYETIEMLRLANTPAVILKKELADIPLFGWLTRRYGVIPVDRGAGAKALRDMLKHARAASDAGRPIVIFPEGTRVPPGQTPPLQAGFSGIYRLIGLPVVTIAVDSGLIWGRGLLKKPGTVRFLIGDVIPAGLPRDEIEARVHAGINALETSAP
jgi:1-acyl-sn-glycerol-3-phosphate acyltransferase